MKKFVHFAAGVLGALVLALGIAGSAAAYRVADYYHVTAGGELSLEQPGLSIQNVRDDTEITAAALESPDQQYEAKLMLMDSIPIKSVGIDVIQEVRLVPCGTPFGIKMFTNGVVVVGVADIQTDGKTINPAAVSGIKVGDIITQINGQAVTQNEQIAAAIAKSEGKPLEFAITRGGDQITAALTPVKSETDGSYKGGLWVRDSTAGIGTVTFYNPTTGAFGGLGHGICDVDTNELMPLGSGEIVPVTISGIVKGEKGRAGELHGYFNSDLPIGNMQANSSVGVYGTLNGSPVPEQSAVKVAMKQEIKTGPAEIYTTLDDGPPQVYKIEIESVNYRSTAKSKNMVIRVTDPALLAKSGGIVQGMSGSPILQDGMLVGAVTHVFINDPSRGYGIFAENMLEISQNVSAQANKMAS